MRDLRTLWNPRAIAVLAVFGFAVSSAPEGALSAQGETPVKKPETPAQKPQGPEKPQDPAQQQPKLRPVDVESIETLIRYVGQREEAVESLTMRLRSRSFEVPEEVSTSETELRVLGGTHQHARTVTSIALGGPEMDVELLTESMQTPEGLFLHERDPIQGELFMRMDQELLEQTRSASKFLLKEQGTLAPRLDPRGKPLLGKSMLEELNRVFELDYSAPAAIGTEGEQFWSVSGAARKAETKTAEDSILGADRVSLLVRVRDGVVTQIRTTDRGRVMFESQVLEIDLNPKLDPKSFRLELPAGREWLDVMSHPPAREQIEAMLDQAKSKGWTPGR